jgi:hypothetical protein
MDFAFLNAFLRSPAWPPGEPWMAGMPLHYYYFGEVLAAFPILVAGCSAGVGYNLIAAAIPAFGAAVLASFGLVLARRRRWFAATLLPVLILATGNLAWPWLLDIAHGGKFFDLWWATSRVVPGFAIDEYPLWTALFADLHGHFIALPVLLMVLNQAYTIGSAELPAPQAGLMALMAQGIVGGDMAWPLVIAGMFLGLALILIKAPAPMLIAVGMYLPFSTTSAVFAGGVIRAVLDGFLKRREASETERVKAENSGILVASGLIAGQSLMAVLLAFVVLYEQAKLGLEEGQHLLPHLASSFGGGLLVYPLLLVLLVWLPLRRMKT